MLHIQSDSSEISSKALNVLISSHIIYLREKAFSELVYVTNKYRNHCLNLESELRLKLSGIEIDKQKLIAEMQLYDSYKPYQILICKIN